jgi:hypothetical protein
MRSHLTGLACFSCMNTYWILYLFINFTINKTNDGTDNRTEESQIKSYTYTLHWHCKTIETGLQTLTKATTQNYNTRSMRSKPSLHFPKLIQTRHGPPIYGLGKKVWETTKLQKSFIHINVSTYSTVQTQNTVNILNMHVFQEQFEAKGIQISLTRVSQLAGHFP